MVAISIWIKIWWFVTNFWTCTSSSDVPYITSRREPTSNSIVRLHSPKEAMTTSDHLITFTLRLHLVRHGETVANRDKIVVGQADSDLTKEGIEHAKALSNDRKIRNTNFWRIYSSDLKRTQHTTALLLQLDDRTGSHKDVNENDNNNPLMTESILYNDYSRNEDIIVTEFSDFLINNNGVHLEQRLREVAKGTRQGFCKSTTIDGATQARRRLNQVVENDPLLETDDDVWIRATAWLYDVITDIIQLEQTNVLEGNSHACQDDNISSSFEDKPSNNKIYSILVVGHSAIFRIFLSRIVGMDKLRSHPDAKFDHKNNFQIPNTSLTILDIQITTPHDEYEENTHTCVESDLLPTLHKYSGDHGIQKNCVNSKVTLKVDVVELTSTRHYS